MSGGVLLARVSLNEKLLAVTDHRGVIMLVSEDAPWALGVASTAPSALVGSSLLSFLTDEDQNECKNAMRRRSGSLLRLKQGCFVWLDITHHPHVTPRLKRVLHRVDRARAAACGSCASCGKSSLSRPRYSHKLGHGWADNKLHKSQLDRHVLGKDRPLQWFLEEAAPGEEQQSEGLSEAADEDSVGAAAAADSLECMSLHSSESGSSSGTPGELPMWGRHGDRWHAQPQQHGQEPTAASASASSFMYKEYSFRDIFEYALGRGSSGSQASGLNLAGSGSSPTEAPASGRRHGASSSTSSTVAAAARAVAAVALKGGHHHHHHHQQQQQRSFKLLQASSLIASKCRAAPESSPVFLYSSSWRAVSGYMAQRAAASVGLSAGSAGSSHHQHEKGGDDGGWGFYADLDLVG